MELCLPPTSAHGRQQATGQEASLDRVDGLHLTGFRPQATNITSVVGPRGAENLDERAPLLDTAEEARTHLSKLEPVNEESLVTVDKGAAVDATEVATDLHDESVAIPCVSPVEPLFSSEVGRDYPSRQFSNGSEESPCRQPVTGPSMPLFKVYNGQLVLSLEFNYPWGNPSTKFSTATPLQWAAITGDLELVKNILESKENACRQSEPESCHVRTSIGGCPVAFSGWSSLSLASYFGHLAVVESLLEHAASCVAERCLPRDQSRPARSPSRETPSLANRADLHPPPLLPPLFAAIASVPYLATLEHFTRRYSLPKSYRSKYQDILKIENLKVFRARQPDLWRYPSPVSRAEEESEKVAIFKALLKNQDQDRAVCVNQQDWPRSSLLQAAACGTSLPIVRMVLELGDKRGFWSKVKRKMRPSSDSDLESPLHLAAFWNRTETIEMLLQLDPDPDLCGYQDRTPLHYAAALGNVEAINVLIKYKATVDALDSKGHRPLDLAVQWDQREAVKALINANLNLSL